MPAPPTASSHCAASNAHSHTPNWCASSSERWVARLVLASQAPARSRPLTASDERQRTCRKRPEERGACTYARARGGGTRRCRRGCSRKIRRQRHGTQPPAAEGRGCRAERGGERGMEGGAWQDGGVPAVRTPGSLAELQGESEPEAAGGAKGRGRMSGREVRCAKRDSGREGRGHEKIVRSTGERDATAGGVASDGGRHGRVATTGGGGACDSTTHGRDVRKVRTAGHVTKAASSRPGVPDDGSRRNGNRRDRQQNGTAPDPTHPTHSPAPPWELLSPLRRLYHPQQAAPAHGQHPRRRDGLVEREHRRHRVIDLDAGGRGLLPQRERGEDGSARVHHVY